MHRAAAAAAAEDRLEGAITTLWRREYFPDVEHESYRGYSLGEPERNSAEIQDLELSLCLDICALRSLLRVVSSSDTASANSSLSSV